MESQDSRESWSLRSQLFVRSGTALVAVAGSEGGGGPIEGSNLSLKGTRTCCPCCPSRSRRPAGTCQRFPRCRWRPSKKRCLEKGSEPLRTMSEKVAKRTMSKIFEISRRFAAGPRPGVWCLGSLGSLRSLRSQTPRGGGVTIEPTAWTPGTGRAHRRQSSSETSAMYCVVCSPRLEIDSMSL